MDVNLEDAEGEVPNTILSVPNASMTGPTMHQTLS